jgi:hypothetical protein
MCFTVRFCYIITTVAEIPVIKGEETEVGFCLGGGGGLLENNRRVTRNNFRVDVVSPSIVSDCLRAGIKEGEGDHVERQEGPLNTFKVIHFFYNLLKIFEARNYKCHDNSECSTNVRISCR